MAVGCGDKEIYVIVMVTYITLGHDVGTLSAVYIHFVLKHWVKGRGGERWREHYPKNINRREMLFNRPDEEGGSHIYIYYTWRRWSNLLIFNSSSLSLSLWNNLCLIVLCDWYVLFPCLNKSHICSIYFYTFYEILYFFVNSTICVSHQKSSSILKLMTVV